MNTIKDLDIGDIVTDGHGAYAEVRDSVEKGIYYANIDLSDILENEVVIPVIDFHVEREDLALEAAMEVEEVLSDLNKGIEELKSQASELDAFMDKIKTNLPDPYVLDINTPVKLPREVAVAFSGGNLGDHKTMIIEAVYIDGLLTLQSIEVPNDFEEFSSKLCSCLLISLQDLVTTDPWRGGDYDHIFRVTGLTWIEDRWIEDDQEVLEFLGDDIKQECAATRKATGAGGEI